MKEPGPAGAWSGSTAISSEKPAPFASPPGPAAAPIDLTDLMMRQVQAGAPGLPAAPAAPPALVPLTPAPPSIGPGVIVGNYQIIEPLGEGGMGQVFIAQHLRLGKRVAIKVLRPEFATSPSTLRRFFQEAQAAGQIENPHIVQIFDFGDDGRGRTFIVMELLNGADLAQVRQRDGPFPLSRILSIVHQVGAGLAAAHDRGIIHRDLKPENIFLVRDEGADYVKLLDFGLAKLSDSHYGSVAKSQAGMVMGTPDFMSPEQAAGTPIDARTDIYALATVLHWMVAGVLPFQAESFPQLLIQRMTQPAPPLPETSATGERVPAALREVVRRALEREREKRPANVREFTRLVEESLTVKTSSPSREDAQAAGLATPARGRRLLWPIAAAAALVGAALAAWFMTRSEPPAEPPAAAAPVTAAKPPPEARPAPLPPPPAPVEPPSATAAAPAKTAPPAAPQPLPPVPAPFAPPAPAVAATPTPKPVSDSAPRDHPARSRRHHPVEAPPTAPPPAPAVKGPRPEKQDSLIQFN